MATDPVQRIRRRSYATQMHRDLTDRIRKLAELSPSLTTPYLTVSLDWRPEGSEPEYRGGLQRFEQEANALRDNYGPRGDSYDSLGEDIERIRAFLEEELEPSAHGVYFVANSARGVFQAIPLNLPVPTRITCGPTPSLLPLIRIVEDHPTYAVLAADQQHAVVSLINQGLRLEGLDLFSSDYPRKQQSGGWSQRRFQQRADERMYALAQEIDDETERLLDARGIDMLIIAGDEPMTSALDEAMSDQLRERIIDRVRFNDDTDVTEIASVTMPIAEQAEREREAAAVGQVNELAGGGRGVAVGSTAVFEALVNGQVEVLVMNEDFHEDGWADFEHHRYGVSEYSDVFTGDGEEINAVPISVEEEMVRLAVLTSAEIDIISAYVPADYGREDEIPDAGEVPRTEAASQLDEHGGVAALLRYEINE